MGRLVPSWCWRSVRRRRRWWLCEAASEDEEGETPERWFCWFDNYGITVNRGGSASSLSECMCVRVHMLEIAVLGVSVCGSERAWHRGVRRRPSERLCMFVPRQPRTQPEWKTLLVSFHDFLKYFYLFTAETKKLKFTLTDTCIFFCFIIGWFIYRLETLVTLDLKPNRAEPSDELL